ncbi:MAG: ABC transporter ATP-binding protein [Pseudomonadales bacterium]|jgi:ABC-2 type transport system ATP-binding protein|nr:ABC transporter ATP-binding protein [Pseudomonadales bacterium]
MIDVSNVTLQYNNGKGVFDLNFKVAAGEVLGYLGPNGAGKTTTIRCLMGFMPVDKGSCKINNLDCFKDAPAIQSNLGYIPGEIAFFEQMTGTEFLRFISDLRGVHNQKLQNELLDRFELDPTGRIKRFSKGMKQKVGIIAAFMHDPQVIILDEPTSGLDPLMQNRFVELVMEAKEQGKTILMSSHMFEEIEKTADRVLVIKDGRIIADNSIMELRNFQKKIYILDLKDAKQIKKLPKKYEVVKIDDTHYEVTVQGDKINKFIDDVSKLDLLNLHSKVQSLEEIFLNYYGRTTNS